MPLDIAKSTVDWFVCLCGNEPDTDGFYACLEDGTLVEPKPLIWKKDLYRCMRCNTIYDASSMEEYHVDNK